MERILSLFSSLVLQPEEPTYKCVGHYTANIQGFDRLPIHSNDIAT